MKRLALILASGLLLGAASAGAAEVSGNVSIGTDYAFRGISQTNENPTVQGGFDVAVDSGLYAGIWASNVAFDGSIEVDLYAGYGGEFTPDVSYDIGILRYEYPDDEQGGAPSSSFNEIYGSVGFAGATLGFAWSPDYFYESDTGLYVYADYGVDLGENFGLSLHYGNQSIDNNVQWGTPDYSDWSIGLSTSAADLDFSLTWYDTDLSDAECFGGSDLCSSRVVLAVGKSL